MQSPAHNAPPQQTEPARQPEGQESLPWQTLLDEQLTVQYLSGAMHWPPGRQRQPTRPSGQLATPQYLP